MTPEPLKLPKRIQGLLTKVPTEDRAIVRRLLVVEQELAKRERTRPVHKLMAEVVSTLGFLSLTGPLAEQARPPKRRIEANALAAYCFRNQPAFENLHASDQSMSDDRVKEIMLEACRRADAWLCVSEAFRDGSQDIWWLFVNGYHLFYCSEWSLK